MPSLTHQSLKVLLQHRNRVPDSAASIDAQINADYVERHAVLVMDMSGFSRLTLKHGIMHFLAMIQRLEAIAIPIVATYQGQVFKQEADNVFALFPAVNQAVDASVRILEALAIANQTTPPDQSLYVSMGIGYGDLICIECGDRICDVYGHEMNLASKLGEDLGEPGEIWLTATAYEQIGSSSSYFCEACNLSVSKVEMVAHKIVHSTDNPAPSNDFSVSGS